MKTIFAGCLVLVAICVGCSKQPTDRGSVQGEVKLDGKPLEQGSILFTPVDGTKGTVTGGEIKNGRYQRSAKDGPAIGKNLVQIRAVRKTGKMVQKPMAKQGELVEEYGEAVAPEFNTASTLKVDIKPGENTADFDVTSVKK